MTSKSAWTTPGYVAAFGTEINSLASGASVMSSIAFTNDTDLQQFMDLSAQCTIASTTITAGSSLSFFIPYLQQDGTTYGDGALVAGSPTATWSPLLDPIGGVPTVARAGVTAIVGDIGLVPIRPTAFRLVATNLILPATALAASGNAVAIKRYSQNLNA